MGGVHGLHVPLMGSESKTVVHLQYVPDVPEMSKIFFREGRSQDFYSPEKINLEMKLPVTLQDCEGVFGDKVSSNI